MLSALKKRLDAVPDLEQPMRILLMGNSHLAAIESAGAEIFAAMSGLSWARINLQGFEHDALAPRQDRRVVLHPQISARLDWVGANGYVFLLLGGSAHDIVGLAEHPVPFDFVSPDRPDLPVDPGRMLVPSAIIERQIAGRNRRRMWDLLDGLRDRYRGPVFQFESPAPIPSEAHIRAWPRSFAEAIGRYGVAPKQLRYKLWLMNGRTARQMCEPFDVEYLSVPAESLDEEGFLQPIFWAHDPNHANAEYGRLLLEEIMRIVRGA